MGNKVTLFDYFLLVLKRDLILSFKKSATFLIPLVFFLIVITFFPLAIGPNKSLLSELSPGIIWVAAILASLLAVESIFNEDFEDGNLDYLLLSGEPTFILVFAKVIAHWLVTGAPIIFASLISTLFLFTPSKITVSLFCSLFIGTLLLSLLGALGGALTIGKSSILNAIIVLPLCFPILLLGTAAVTAAINEQDFISYLYFMAAMLAIGIPGLCLAIVEAIGLNYE